MRDRSGFLFGLEKRFQVHFGGSPVLFYGLYALLGKNRQQVIRPETQLLIEGFPRSANSFALVAFIQAQRRARLGRGRVANNLHVPAQVIRAARWGVPALVLIRPPEDAVISFGVRDGISLRLALNYYSAFYEKVEPYRDYFVLGRFEEVTTDFGAVTRRVNERFGTGFALFKHTERHVQRVYDAIDGTYRRNYTGGDLELAVSRPAPERRAAALALREELKSRRDLFEPLARAEAVYWRMVGD